MSSPRFYSPIPNPTEKLLNDSLFHMNMLSMTTGLVWKSIMSLVSNPNEVDDLKDLQNDFNKKIEAWMKDYSKDIEQIVNRPKAASIVMLSSMVLPNILKLLPDSNELSKLKLSNRQIVSVMKDSIKVLEDHLVKYKNAVTAPSYCDHIDTTLAAVEALNKTGQSLSSIIFPGDKAIENLLIKYPFLSSCLFTNAIGKDKQESEVTVQPVSLTIRM